ncbi:DUF6638 family protein [Pseudoprimorskyibacter insulae]|uniref:Uncharacterized protein n=1 Tax=Pseudoprimorskyibacter insulae TaxID=1695997 RepID=A0A2R8ATT0_9RHOB|nr:DUF6638 family protein [Pseudoprimorskyibacter insulae]SPF79463.1 hypothetical protein PRI8871_01259 [Pseudoprimorskyibacter insulae]
MQRLIQSGLMFGNLIPVTSPALVERYNRALQHLTGKTTGLTDFHIDISGFSPEIGDEFDDPLYLNQNGVNRQFILLTTRQKTAPLLNAQFSASRSILRRFIETNESQLFALTARDVVIGELLNSVFMADTPRRLFAIRKLTVEADTVGGTVRDATALGQKVDQFKSREDAWFDDVLIAEMISLSKRTGDIVRNPVRLKHMEFDLPNFWTAHFGGLYLFRGPQEPALICAGDKVTDVPIDRVIGLQDRNRLAMFLERNNLAEPLVRSRGINAADILRQKMDFIVVDVAQDLGIDLAGATRSDMRRITRQVAGQLPEEWHGLDALLRWAEGTGAWPRITSDHPAYFYSLRASDHSDAALVNRLLAELTTKDVRQLFICHKELFYRLYSTWNDTKRAYVADFLKREYLADKAGARAALFGHDAPMEAPEPDDLIDRVGPWGAVRRT